MCKNNSLRLPITLPDLQLGVKQGASIPGATHVVDAKNTYISSVSCNEPHLKQG